MRIERNSLNQTVLHPEYFCANSHKDFVENFPNREFIEQVELEATTKDSGTTLRAPTSEAGLAPACKDTCFAGLRLRLWERHYDGTEGKVHFGLHLKWPVKALISFCLILSSSLDIFFN